MNLFLTIRIALRALGKNKMRAGLTVLGVVIGIASVTTMVSIGQSAGGLVQSQFELLGTNVILVFPGRRRGDPVLRGGGDLFRLLSGAASQSPRSDRGAALRVAFNGTSASAKDLAASRPADRHSARSARAA